MSHFTSTQQKSLLNIDQENNEQKNLDFKSNLKGQFRQFQIKKRTNLDAIIKMIQLKNGVKVLQNGFIKKQAIQTHIHKTSQITKKEYKNLSHNNFINNQFYQNQIENQKMNLSSSSNKLQINYKNQTNQNINNKNEIKSKLQKIQQKSAHDLGLTLHSQYNTLFNKNYKKTFNLMPQKDLKKSKSQKNSFYKTKHQFAKKECSGKPSILPKKNKKKYSNFLIKKGSTYSYFN